MESEFECHVETVAIIGAGPGGLAAAKYAQSERAFSQITIYERRSKFGGVWNPDAWSSARDAALFPSPVYETMESNIPKEMMEFSDTPYDEDCPLFPNVRETLDYLEKYAKDVRSLIRLQTQVVDITPLSVNNPNTQWRVTAKNLESDEVSYEVYDAVVVANGHYSAEYYPPIPGLDSWKASYPGSVLHSKWFRERDMFKDKKTVIVGFADSGVDLAIQIGSICAQPLIISQSRKAAPLPGSQLFAKGKLLLPELIRLDKKDRKLVFENGREEKDVDYVVFCTGYEYEFPFLSGVPGLQDQGFERCNETFQHIFYASAPTLAFILVPLRIISIPFAESQSAVLVRVWSRRLRLPSVSAMRAWVKERQEKCGKGKGYQRLGHPADSDYMDEMYHWCTQVRASPNGPEKMPPLWGAREIWLKQKLRQIQLAARELGDEERRLLRSIEQLGFHF